MPITRNSVEFRGQAAEPILEELLFENETISQELVMFEDDVKANTIFSEESAEAVMQAYTSGAPTSEGSLGGFDAVVTPEKIMYYQEFDPDTLRFSRYKRSMRQGAWETFSDEFERVVIGGVYAGKISADAEAKFWNNATAATKAAVAGLTAGTAQDEVGTEEQALVAATPDGLFDGIVQKMIYNTSRAGGTAAVGERVKVVGDTITASNIKAEYDKLYAAIPAVVLSGNTEPPYIYAPRSHKQLINIYNNNPSNYKDAFSVSEDKTRYYFNGVEIKFVPIPENVMIAAKKEHLFWCTDLIADFNDMKLDKIANNQEKMFLKNIMALQPHVAHQAFNVLYVG